MPLHRWRSATVWALVTVGLTCAHAPAHALKVVTWNLLQYPTNNLAGRQPHFRTVMADINADVLIAQELNSAAGRDSFLNNVLNVVQPGEWTATSWLSVGSGEGMAVFYKSAKVTVTGLSAIGDGGPRNVLQCLMKPVGYTATAAGTRLYSVHLKASNTQSDIDTRALECTNLRTTLNSAPAGTNLLLGGDTNIYTANEVAYTRLTESQADNDGRFKDPLLMPGNWHENSGYALYHTQCPCNTGCAGGFPGGGMDDRFDLWLTSYGMQDGEGLDYAPHDPVFDDFAYPYQYANDGGHYNTDINAFGANDAVPIAVANALHDASDHLPVVMYLQVPAKVVVASTLDFGSVIVGATASQSLAVSNGAGAPADELTYTLAAPAGFTAPGGTFTANAGAGANSHAIGMSTAASGTLAGNLTVNSDDLDLPASDVALTGTVLDHAAASLDSTASLLTTTLDFGDHAIGSFSDQALRVHDLGYDALQARLSVNSANIVGGDSRFSIVGGFSAALLAGVGKTWNVHFNDAGATLDQEYTATLTLASTDEALPGSAAASDLVVTLRAKRVSGPVGVPGQELPKILAFYPPHPNPLSRQTVFSFDLPARARVSLAIYDPSGRQVASLVSGTLEADRYQVRWQGESMSGGRAPAGLYFARFTTPGLSRVARVVVLP
jgi:endonuclease/exonuclease/phosphatase family metal-dependent hydrolase